MSENKPLMTKPDAAKFLGVSTRTLDRWNRNDEGPRRQRVGGRNYYSAAEIERFLSTFQSQ
jgi:DNA-binding transcriptional MerR regulator